MKVLHNNVFVDITEMLQREKQPKEEVRNGIIFPSTNNKNEDKLMEVKVVEISSMIKDCEIKVGDTILVSKYFGHRYKKDNIDYGIIDYNTILAVLE